MSIADLIDESVKRAPYKKALFYPSAPDKNGKTSYSHLTYADLRTRAEKVADGLKSRGVKRGTKVLLFLRPSLEFPVISYALFKIGATAILIDPGMGRKNLFECIKEVKPEVLIAVPDVYIGRRVFPKTFASVKTFIIIDQGGAFKSVIAKLTNSDALNFVEIEETGKPVAFTEKLGANDLAAIVFTSGGTGKPKGVEYTHKIYEHQVELLKKTYKLTEDDVDLPAFPLFALFTLAMGMSVVIPDMDPTKPSQACPQTLVEHITNHGVSFAGGSPAIWERVSGYLSANKLTLSSMRSLMMFGAPVATRIHKEFKDCLPNGTTYTPYGSTECLPVSTISGRELLAGALPALTLDGKGTCVGKAADGTEIKIVAPTETAIGFLDEARELPVGQIGEIIVKGPQTTRSYHNLEGKTLLAKIYDKDGFWHRMGDMGYLDEEGRLWFCGRQAHSMVFQGERLYSVMTEAHYNNHPNVRRSALVNLGSEKRPKPAIVIEPKNIQTMNIQRKEMEDISKKIKLSEAIEDYFIDESFPVDVRHNIKIDRKLLGEKARSGDLNSLN